MGKHRHGTEFRCARRPHSGGPQASEEYRISAPQPIGITSWEIILNRDHGTPLRLKCDVSNCRVNLSFRYGLTAAELTQLMAALLCCLPFGKDQRAFSRKECRDQRGRER
jgi:hypothetical protein